MTWHLRIARDAMTDAQGLDIRLHVISSEVAQRGGVLSRIDISLHRLNLAIRLLFEVLVHSTWSPVVTSPRSSSQHAKRFADTATEPIILLPFGQAK